MEILNRFVILLGRYCFIALITILLSILVARASKSEVIAVNFFATLSAFLIILLLNTLPIRSFILHIVLFILLHRMIWHWLFRRREKTNWYYDQIKEKVEWLPNRN